MCDHFHIPDQTFCWSYGRFRILRSLKLSWPCRPPGDKVFNFFFWFCKTKRWCRSQHENVETSNLINDAHGNCENRDSNNFLIEIQTSYNWRIPKFEGHPVSICKLGQTNIQVHLNQSIDPSKSIHQWVMSFHVLSCHVISCHPIHCKRLLFITDESTMLHPYTSLNQPTGLNWIHPPIHLIHASIHASIHPPIHRSDPC